MIHVLAWFAEKLMTTAIMLGLCTLTLQAQTPDSAARGVSDGIREPSVMFKVDPEYSAQALAAHLEGIVMLQVIVGSDGQPHDIKVAKGLGMGLDEKAIEAVSQWKFNPGMKDGQPVNVRANVEVNFKIAKSEMVLNSSIGNDPSLEKLCIERTHAGIGFTIRGEPMPFEIDARYVAQSRSYDSTATFVALGDGFKATLVECGNQHSGAFHALSVQSDPTWYWHLLPNPKYDPQGLLKASGLCLTIARTRIKEGFETISIFGTPGIPRVGTLVAGIITEPYDIVAIGHAAYPGRPDMVVAKFTCVFSPALALKTIEINPARFKK